MSDGSCRMWKELLSRPLSSDWLRWARHSPFRIRAQFSVAASFANCGLAPAAPTWRALYRQVDADTFVVLAIRPDAKVNRRGFDHACRVAQQRFASLKE